MMKGCDMRCRLPFVIAISLVAGLLIAVIGAIPFLRERRGISSGFDLVFSIMAVFFIPGDIVSIAVSRNFHDHSFILGMILNWLIYAVSLFLLLNRKCKAEDGAK
jgi:hypothetical protein